MCLQSLLEFLVTLNSLIAVKLFIACSWYTCIASVPHVDEFINAYSYVGYHGVTGILDKCNSIMGNYCISWDNSGMTGNWYHG